VDLARRLRADVMMTSQVLRTLERRRLVARDLDPADARARRVRLTGAGARLVERVSAIVNAAEDAYFGALGIDRREFASALGRLIGVRVRLRVPAGSGIAESPG
jgi:DNA-binding MarR family transcriptional regulator